MRGLSSVCLLALGVYVFGWSVALFLVRWSRRRRARHIYRIRHERLLRAYEKAFHDNVSQNLNWTQDDITELLSLTVTRKLESARRHVREVKQARHATKQLKARLAKGDTK